MDLDPGWEKKVVKKLLLEEEQKEEKKYPLNQIPKMVKFKSLNQNKHFLRILKKRRLNAKYFTIYFEKNLNDTKKDDNKNLKISFVVKKNIGNAVTRNKIKRKLKAAVQKVAKENQLIDLNYTYVIFGRNNVYSDKSLLIVDEFDSVFKRIKQIDK